ncbi:uncharacterized protein LOC5520586 [Nematostella vectensis]|nr:uncharacterized protein LOC5520586 [Nematostella vectensis]
MSTAAEIRTGYAQGTDTAAVLTNHSKYITIIADEPYFSRHYRPVATSNFHRKGTRPTHRTTLTFEVCPFKTSYKSTFKENFSGSKTAQPSKRPPAFPSQHTSQFNIGPSQDHLLNTRTRETYITHDIKPSSQTHEHNQRWNHQMAGHDMVQSTRYKNSSQINFETTYSSVHDSLGKQRGPGVRMCYPTQQRYNIITGSDRPSFEGDYHRISGNRVLHSARAGQESIDFLD